ncbi:MAG: ABC transporter permease [Verrucomicrobia bacterium]|jgi:ABC-2 type transport system permease protein|nr:ABC transporter permease [Verrucomicrobiota bacterium]
MKLLLDITINDLRLFLKDKAGYVWLFLAPLAFIYFTGLVGSGSNSAPSNPRPSVMIDNQDTGFMGQLLIKEMDAKGLQIIESDPEKKASRRIHIPADFTEKIKSKQKAKLIYTKRESSSVESAIMVEMRLIQATLGINAHLVEWATQEGGGEELILSEDSLTQYINDEDPIALSANFAGKNPVPSGFKQSLPGYLVMFIMMNLLIFGGISIASERKNGVLRRLATLPIRRWQIVVGKIAGRFLLGCVMIAFLLTVSWLLFGVDVAQSPVALLLTLGLFTWLAASLGVLVGSINSNPDKIVGLCVVLSMMMSALGGCWWPLEITPDSMQLVGHLFPTAWAMDALHQLISFGGGLQEIRLELGVLAGFALVTNLLAARFLKYTEA